MPSSDEIMARANELLDRAAANRAAGSYDPKRRRQKESEVGRRLTRIGIANGLIIAAAVVFALAISPLGLLGAVGVAALMLVATLLLAALPAGAPAPSTEKLRQTPLAALPAQTERWLEAQRPALPAPALTLIDQIGIRLETLQPQLATLSDDHPAAAEVRKLISEQLPEFVNGYRSVPPPLRTVERNGKTPDAQLTDGLKVIEREIGDMTEQLAEGALDQLATRGRFLEIKYQGDS